MRIPVFIFLMIACFATAGFGQSLLVNGSFEDENICTEYKVNCAPEGWISTSTLEGFHNYHKDPKGAFHGIHCMSIEAGRTRNKYKRTHIRTQILCALRKNHRYRIEFYVRSYHKILDSVGIYFTSYDFLFEKKPTQDITPDKFLGDDPFVRNGDTSWQKVTLDYTAKGTERYLAIGNFSKRDINGETKIPMENRFFVYIDLITMVPLSPHETICFPWRKEREKIYEFNDRHEFLQQYVSYYRNNNKLPEEAPLHPTLSPKVDTLVVPDVLFAFDRSDLTRASHGVLDSFCTMIKQRKIDSIIVEGHTDSKGSDTYNWQLSINRAGTVARYLVTNCRQRDEIIYTRSWASERPVADNSTPEGRQLNRRVEILLYLRE